MNLWIEYYIGNPIGDIVYGFRCAQRGRAQRSGALYPCGCATISPHSSERRARPRRAPRVPPCLRPPTHAPSPASPSHRSRSCAPEEAMRAHTAHYHVSNIARAQWSEVYGCGLLRNIMLWSSLDLFIDGECGRRRLRRRCDGRRGWAFTMLPLSFRTHSSNSAPAPTPRGRWPCARAPFLLHHCVLPRTTHRHYNI